MYFKRLWDFRGIAFDWTTEMLREVADYCKLRYPKSNRGAFLVDNDLAFGVIRIFLVHREDDGVSLMNVFRNYDEAIDFLNAEPQGEET